MGFPRSLMTDVMALYVLGNFELYHRKVTFPSASTIRLQKVMPILRFGYGRRDYEVPKLPQGVFMAMLLNDAMKLGVLIGWMISVMESALKELHGLDVIGVGSWKPIDRRSPETEEMADCVRENLQWHWRSASRPPCPLPEDYRELCPHFALSKAEEAARDFELPEIVQATFYAMLLNDAIELGIVNGFIAADLKAFLEGLRWTSFESWMNLFRGTASRTVPQGGAREPVIGATCQKRIGRVSPWERERDRQSERGKTIPFLNFTSIAAEYIRDTFRWCLRESSALHPNPLPEDYHNLCPGFNPSMAIQYAHNSNIPKMVQAIFYAMILNDTAELGLPCRINMNYIIPTMPKLDYLGDLAVGNLAKAPEGSDPPSCESTREPYGIQWPNRGLGF
ncbi:LOW QUALITY PROTEIN: hypothetical protein Cgig2_027302 [Carnegiea gigantea]|uniref:Uncharacterized protein n=1 Tax=Carnegiea gigantea TaxID=171969 RepID=A0A9Q1JW90_9CARY|nr:LOW QUALITY PROTEIN: hypothetical protein Cgig2_027302 [Carnegiea gigantea]